MTLIGATCRAVVLALLAGGCTTESAPIHASAGDAPRAVDDAAPGADDAGLGVSFSREVFPTVKRSCALSDCHDRANTANHFTDFSTAALTYSRWVNGPGTDFCVPRPAVFVSRIIVVPGRPAESLLIDKITSTREEVCNDNHHPRMPPLPWPPLPPEEIETFTRWVAEGARQN